MGKNGFTVTSSKLRIENEWIRDIISEILSTYVFVLFAISAVAQEVLSGWHHSSIFIVNFAASLGLTMAIYVGGNASGGYVNPGIALSMCLTGYLKWKKYPIYVVCHMIGAFLASSTVFGVYYGNINDFDGGTRQLVGPNGTAIIFVSFPDHDYLSKGSAFVEVMIGHALLVGCTLAILDSRNMGPSTGLAPIPIGLSVLPICSGFGYNTGCPINAAKDMAPRIMLTLAGYGSGVWGYWDYWFWMPTVATTTGSILAVLLYQLSVSVQLAPVVEANRLEIEQPTPLKEVQTNGNKPVILEFDPKNFVYKS